MRNFAKTSYKKYLLAGATVLAMGAAPMVAHATPYAFASNQITGLSVTQASGSPYTSVNGTDQISGNASYNGTSFAGKTLLSGPVDSALSFTTQPAVVTSGTAPTGYTSSTPGTFTGTRGNASITAGPPSNVNNVAEGYGNATLGGTSSAGNSSTVKLNITGTGQALKVSFSDAIDLIASTAGLNGENANATVADSLSLYDSTGKLVASYSPFGTLMGGTSTGTNFATSHVGSQAGTPPSANYSDTGAFTFTTDFALASGSTYTVSLNSSAQEFINSGTPVPEPGSLVLLGTGLLGLALVSRKRVRKG